MRAVACKTCGYDLRHHARGGVCPRCATTVGATLDALSTQSAESAEQRHPAVPPAVWLGAVCLLPIWLPLTGALLFVVAVVGLVVVPWSRYADRLLFQRMQANGRTISEAELLAEAERGGTVIIEWSAAPGWWPSRLWWTSDDVLRRAPEPPTSDREHPLAPTAFERWCSATYLDPVEGEARLHRVDQVMQRARRLAQLRPGLRIVRVVVPSRWGRVHVRHPAVRGLGGR